MKKVILTTIAFLAVLAGLYFYLHYSPPIKIDRYVNLYTNQEMDPIHFHKLLDSLLVDEQGNRKQDYTVITHIEKMQKRNDSTIAFVKYSLKGPDGYIIRAHEPKNLGLTLEPTWLATLDGDSIQIGGYQDKPMVVNLWFIHCPGCVAEIPLLNKMKDAYGDKINFVAITFDPAHDVTKFLKKRSFNFTHVVDARAYIDSIGSSPFPETIFITKEGTMKYVESVFSPDAEVDYAYCKKLMDDLLQSKIAMNE
jgi:thiol-disulfide isomerase/thioredoxin